MINSEEALRRIRKYRYLLGMAELAEVLGVSKQYVYSARKRRQLPAVMADLSMGPVWATSDIVIWLEARATVEDCLPKETAPVD